MSNVNNLNGVPNFGQGDEMPQVEVSQEQVIPKAEEMPAIDDTSSSVETVTSKPHKSKVRSAAQKALGGKY